MAKVRSQRFNTSSTATTLGTQDMTEENKQPVEEVVEVTAPVVEVAKPKVEERQVKATSSYKDHIEKIKVTGTDSARMLIRAFENYMDAMMPGKPVENAAGAQNQYVLWKTISAIAEKSTGGDFNQLWNLMLLIFNNNKESALHDRYIFRFSEYWHYSEADLAGFQRIINLIKLTADPAGRVLGLKQVDLNRTLAVGFTEEARNRIVGFYKA